MINSCGLAIQSSRRGGRARLQLPALEATAIPPGLSGLLLLRLAGRVLENFGFGGA